MKKKLVLLMMSVVLLFTMVPPKTGYASELDKINQQLSDLENQMRSAEKKQQAAQYKISSAEAGKKKTQADLEAISNKIDAQVNEMAKVSTEIDQAEANLEENARQLEEANKRIEERSELLDSRVQLMYMNGRVSYLDVLFSATSFSDFLSRLDSIEIIAGTDKKILDDHKRDKQLVLDKKKEIEEELVQVRGLYAKLEQTKQDLMNQEKEKEVMIAGFDDQIEEMHGLSEEQDEMLVQFLQQRSELQKKQIEEVEKERKRKEAAKKKAKPSSGGGSGPFNGGELAVPLKDDYVISSRFGSRTDPVSGRKGAFHSGLDMATPGGTPIYAAESGVVILAEWWSGYGNCVIIDHGNGLWTLYGHIRNGGIKVEKGDKVNQGDKIAEVGTTGNSTGNHLHFEVRVDGDKVDPEPYLK
ncbi:murein hydrolase activator EnvC family protein [Paenibacillus marinisediminis]